MSFKLHRKETPTAVLVRILTTVKDSAILALIYITLTIWSLISLVGLGWMVMTSLKTNQELFANVWALPAVPQWINYQKAWVNSNLSHYFFNSIVVTFFGIIITAVIASMASYVIARYRFVGNRFLLTYFMSGFAIPVQLTIVPIYIFLNQMNLVNNLAVLVVLYITGSLSFSIFTMVGFFRSIPQEMEEAAILDGASEYQVFWKIMLPLAKPGLVTITIFNFLYVWNEYFLAVLLLNDSAKMTISVGLYFMKAQQGYAANWVGMLAGLIIVLIPSILFFLVFQKQISSGLTAGALKG